MDVQFVMDSNGGVGGVSMRIMTIVYRIYKREIRCDTVCCKGWVKCSHGALQDIIIIYNWESVYLSLSPRLSVSQSEWIIFYGIGTETDNIGLVVWRSAAFLYLHLNERSEWMTTGIIILANAIINWGRSGATSDWNRIIMSPPRWRWSRKCCRW